jgi:transcriptional regulator with XRE-family HTH domain
MRKQQRVTFGQVIAEARKNIPLTLREAAEHILKEGGESISFQYLSELENDRRNPPSGHLIEAIARAYKISPAYLYLKAHRLPPDIDPRDAAIAEAALEALRKELKPLIAA